MALGRAWSVAVSGIDGQVVEIEATSDEVCQG